jgi:hypothetical protein
MSAQVQSSANRRMRKAVREPLWAVLNAAARPTSSLRVLPHDLVVGAQRSGTTSLQRALMEHPNIHSARMMKGVHYFDTAYEKGPTWYRAHFPTQAYARWIEHRTDDPLCVGEASPYYMFHPLAPQRIHDELPGVKLIAMLRDPVERTISHHKHEVRRGNEPYNLEQALAQESTRLAGEEQRIRSEPGYNSFAHQTYSYLARSMYDRQIARLVSLFGRERVLVMPSEAYFADPRRMYESVLEFLDVPIWVPHDFEHANATVSSSVAPATRRRLVQAFATSNQQLFQLLGEEFPWQ